MANQIPTYMVTEFTDQVEYLAQQLDSRFWSAATIKEYRGSGAVATEQVGLTQAQLVTGRGQPVQITDTPASRRWIYPAKYAINDFVDTFEELEIEIQPTGWIAGAQVGAMNRQKDDTFLANFFGTAQTLNTQATGGNVPTTAVTFPTAQIVNSYVGTSGTTVATGMNVPKLRAARKLFLAAEVDLRNDPAYAGLNNVQLDNMLNQAQAISMDFQDKPVLQEGQITRFMGFEFIHTERTFAAGTDTAGSATGGPFRQVPLWVKSGMRVGNWMAERTDMFQRNDLTARPWQVSTFMMVGATRLQEVKCVQANCIET